VFLDGAGICLKGFSFALVWAIVASPVGAVPVETTSRPLAIDVGGRQRTFIMHVAPSLRPDVPVPLVLILHGGGGTGKGMEQFTGFSPLADRDGFIAVYPDAIDRNWNDGREAPAIPSQRAGIDDVAFISTLISSISSRYHVDPKRIYATGISNGGFMSQLLAARLSTRVVGDCSGRWRHEPICRRIAATGTTGLCAHHEWDYGSSGAIWGWDCRA